MAELGSQQGVFDEGESNILRNLLRFNTIFAKDVMTPRTVMVAADQEMTISSFHEKHPNLRFSRIPIFEGSQDHISGYILKDQVLTALVDGQSPILFPIYSTTSRTSVNISLLWWTSLAAPPALCPWKMLSRPSLD